MIIERKRKGGEIIETKFSPAAKQLVRKAGTETHVYTLADEVTFINGKNRHTTTVTPANRTWSFGIGGIATIRG